MHDAFAERLSRWSLLDFLSMVHGCAEGLAQEAGVGGVETAGHLISYLADHPGDIEPFMVGGVFELPMRWIEGGRLTYYANNGQIMHPSALLRSRNPDADPQSV
jgi:hypothetical protein